MVNLPFRGWALLWNPSMPVCANRFCRCGRELLRRTTAARTAVLEVVAGLTIALSANVAQAQVYQSIMTRPVGGNGFTAPSADNSPSGPIRTLDVAIDDGSSDRPGLLADGPTAAVQPANPELLPNVLSPNGPIVTGPAQPSVGVAQPGMYPIGVAPPPGPLSPDQSIDSGQPTPHHPIRDGFRRLFGPEPNGNWLNEPVHFDTFLGFLDDRTAENTGVSRRLSARLGLRHVLGRRNPAGASLRCKKTLARW